MSAGLDPQRTRQEAVLHQGEWATGLDAVPNFASLPRCCTLVLSAAPMAMMQLSPARSFKNLLCQGHASSRNTSKSIRSNAGVSVSVNRLGNIGMLFARGA
ncbi:hypothetical protein ACWC9S_08155 [Streptomyces xiamenensis]